MVKKTFTYIVISLLLISCSGSSSNTETAIADAPAYTELAYAMVQSATDEVAAAESLDEVLGIEKKLVMDMFDFFVEHEKDMNENSDIAESFSVRLDSLMNNFNALVQKKKQENLIIEQL